MTSLRERVLTALNHREPDKVPIDLAATTVTSITYPVYQTMREYLGMEPVFGPFRFHRDDIISTNRNKNRTVIIYRFRWKYHHGK